MQTVHLSAYDDRPPDKSSVPTMAFHRNGPIEHPKHCLDLWVRIYSKLYGLNICSSGPVR